jgi:hypothetical protein
MRRLSLLVAIAILTGLLSAPAVLAAGPSTAFSGEWIGQDPAPPRGDGSTVHLSIKGGTDVQITFVDDFGTICVDEGSPVTVFTSRLDGSVEGNVLTATFRWAKCGPLSLGFLTGATAVYELNVRNPNTPADDTLWDGFVLWHRA